MKRALMFLCMAASSVSVNAAAGEKDTLIVNETDLCAFEPHQEVLLTVTKPLYRVGEILELGNGGGYVVPVDFRWKGNHWEYTCVPVRVGTKSTKGH